MSKIWRIIWYEYTRHVLRKRFLFALLSVPLWIIVMFGVGILAVVLGMNTTPVGYVDHSGLLENPPVMEEESFDSVQFIKYADEAAARAALDADEIQGYYVIPANYRETLSAQLYFLEEPDSNIKEQFEEMLSMTVLAEQPPEIRKRITEGPELLIHATEENRQMETTNWFKIVAPIAAGIFLITSVFTSSGYLMQAVVEEKENRTMEILATSVSPGQIMTGKTIALIGVGLTQILAWGLFPLIGILIVAPVLPFIAGVEIDWGTIGLIGLLAVPTFIFISAIMAAIGATVTESREGQQVSGIITLPVMVPYMLSGVLISNPGGPIAIFLSFFPLTAALTVLLRMAFSTVPTWQILLSAAILWVAAIGGLWFAGRVFRLGMLRYGQRLGWKEIFRSFAKAKV